MSEERNTFSQGSTGEPEDGSGTSTGGPMVPPRPQTPPQAPAEPTTEQYRSVTGEPRTGTFPAGGSPGATPPPTGGGHFPPGAAFSPAPRRQPKRFGTATLISGMVIAALIGGGSAVGANYLMDGSEQPTASSSQKSDAVVINNPENVTAVSAAAAKASPSVVTIEVDGQKQGGSGSGIILDTDGHILTNTHVVTLGGTVSDPKITVRTSDGQVHQATVVGTDPMSDLAVIKIEADGLQPAKLGDSSKLNVGDSAIAIGAPLGLSGTVTDGIISTLNRTISVASSAVPDSSAQKDSSDEGNQFNFEFPGEKQQQQSAGSGSIYVNVIQTDAAINHGNSGGALVNTKGEIVGVNVAIASAGGSGSTGGDDSGSIGVGFAIPMDYAHRIANDIIEDGSATHGLLGVTVKAKQADSGTQFSVGAEVQEVTSGSPADKAGMKSGDVITKVGERQISDSQSLTAAIREYAKGSQAKITFTRGDGEKTVEATVGALPAD
ncbi:trypsin-like peptidase domain-containing protein [Arthrobacter sp. AOP36-C1-22]|uniref:trypsin-like peptidase domain-containing protein n=1 Tax=Arthrobacter sp. AOP36-C1-22 TaxID=3457683 RepID=UPI00264C3DBC|nr:trypsin-like peptidase domain-containing protein [Micrococcaceae bacterium]